MACTELRLAGTEPESIVDGRGFRYTIFVQGCPHHCPDCQNPQTHDFNGGYLVSIDRLLTEIKENPMLRGLPSPEGNPSAKQKVLPNLLSGLKMKRNWILPCILDGLMNNF